MPQEEVFTQTLKGASILSLSYQAPAEAGFPEFIKLGNERLGKGDNLGFLSHLTALEQEKGRSLRGKTQEPDGRIRRLPYT